MTDKNKCECNVMNLIKTEDTQDDNIIRYYECGECGNTQENTIPKMIIFQEDVYKLIESKNIGVLKD